MESIRKSFGRRLREARKKAGFTAESLSEKTGIHPNTVYHLERGENWISAEFLEKLSLALKIPPAALFTDDVVKIEPTPEECLEILAHAIRTPSISAPALTAGERKVLDAMRAQGFDDIQAEALLATITGHMPPEPFDSSTEFHLGEDKPHTPNKRSKRKNAG